MAPHSVLKAYKDVQIESVAHGGRGAELVVMLYDGILEALGQAQHFAYRREYRDVGRQCSKALTILAGLRDTLDFEHGEPVASNLLSFYNIITSKIIGAQTRREYGLLDEAVSLIRSVREAWAQLAVQAAVVSKPAVTPGHVDTSRSSAVVPSGAGVAAAV
jgi:flagellar protein FliS